MKEDNKMKTVIGVFDDRENAQFAIQCLKTAGYKTKNISIIMKAPILHKEEVKNSEILNIRRTTVTGVTTGAVVGGLAGLLIAIGTLAVPGIGSILIAGPLAAMLGLTGAAAATASGAVTGAVAGGALAAMMSLGIPKKEAQLYEQRVEEGALLLAIPALDEQENEVELILHDHDATDIKAVDIPLYYSHNDTVNNYGEQAQGNYASIGFKGGKRGEHSKHIQDVHLKTSQNTLAHKNNEEDRPEIDIK